jgi:hypothetical protein
LFSISFRSASAQIAALAACADLTLEISTYVV